MQETPVQSLGLEDALEKKMATHASIAAWKVPWTEEPGGLSRWSPWGGKESDATEHTCLSWSTRHISHKTIAKILSYSLSLFFIYFLKLWLKT